MQERKLLENVVFMRLKERCFLKNSSCTEQDLSGASFAGERLSAMAFRAQGSDLLRLQASIISQSSLIQLLRIQSDLESAPLPLMAPRPTYLVPCFPKALRLIPCMISANLFLPLLSDQLPPYSLEAIPTLPLFGAAA
jgi:hypothetical protein